jgi:hyperosmotically inducible periplasmic protein
MSVLKKFIVLICLLVFLGIGTIGCEQEGPAERTGEKMDDAAEQVGEKAEELTEKTGEELEEAGEKMQ